MQKHFGTLDNLRVQARKWAELNHEFDDVIDYLPKESEQREVAPNKTSSEGWVYLLKMGNYFKIGRGEDLERRIKQVTVALPDKSTLVHSIKTDDTSGIKAYWHQRFREKRANGEWFALDAADVPAFIAHLFPRHLDAPSPK